MTGPLRLLTALMLVVWLVLPLVPLAIWSVARSWYFPDLLPSAWSLKGWREALAPGSAVLSALWQSLQVAALTTALSVGIGLPAGRALGLYRFPGKAAVELLVLAPTIVPGIAVALGLHAVFLTLGLTGTLAGVVLVHLVPTLPYMVLVLAGVFANFDTAYEEQARSLGASPLRIFRHVTLPAIAPGLMAGALFAFLVSWSQYLLTLLIGGGKVQTLPLLLFSYAGAGRNDLTGVIGMIYILPGALALILTARRLTGQGPALGGAQP